MYGDLILESDFSTFVSDSPIHYGKHITILTELHGANGSWQTSILISDTESRDIYFTTNDKKPGDSLVVMRSEAKGEHEYLHHALPVATLEAASEEMGRRMGQVLTNIRQTLKKDR